MARTNSHICMPVRGIQQPQRHTRGIQIKFNDINRIADLYALYSLFLKNINIDIYICAKGDTFFFLYIFSPDRGIQAYKSIITCQINNISQKSSGIQGAYGAYTSLNRRGCHG